MHYACEHNLGGTGERSDLCRKDFRSVMPLAQEAHKPMFG